MSDREHTDNSQWMRDARVDYLASAPEKLAKLEKAIDGLESNPASHVHERRLRLLLHNLIGSGGSYGFPAVTETAIRMTECLSRRQDDSLPVDPDILTDLRSRLARLREIFANYQA